MIGVGVGIMFPAMFGVGGGDIISPLLNYLVDENGDYLVDENGDYLLDFSSNSWENLTSSWETININWEDIT